MRRGPRPSATSRAVLGSVLGTDPDRVADGMRADLRRTIGATALERLVDAHANHRLRVPEVPRASHPLSATLGAEAFERLVRTYGGVALRVPATTSSTAPMLVADATRMYSEGIAVDVIARQLRTSPTRVRELLSKSA